jgi:hypothetical protein
MDILLTILVLLAILALVVLLWPILLWIAGIAVVVAFVLAFGSGSPRRAPAKDTSATSIERREDSPPPAPKKLRRWKHTDQHGRVRIIEAENVRELMTRIGSDPVAFCATHDCDAIDRQEVTR